MSPPASPLGPEGPGNTNPLAAGPAALPPGHPGPSPHADMLVQMHKQAMAQYQQIAKADELATKVREGIDTLVDKGDAVTDDDVVDEMSKLVGAGADPAAMGALIAGGQGQPPMPQGGPGLAQWLLAKDQLFQQQEQAIAGPLAQARLAVMNSAIHLLTHDHVLRKGAPNAGTDSGPELGASPAGSDAVSESPRNGPFAGGPPGNA